MVTGVLEFSTAAPAELHAGKYFQEANIQDKNAFLSKTAITRSHLHRLAAGLATLKAI